MLHALIMAGGSGTRFWPYSRKTKPKQFLNLFGERSLLQATFDRIGLWADPDRILLMTNKDQLAETRKQLPELAESRVVGEPAGRDTAPCIALAAALIDKQDPDATMVVLAADHRISTDEQFAESIRSAETFLNEHPDTLITFGVQPNRPATEYGYLEVEDNATNDSDIRKLKAFREKPDAENATKFVQTGRHFWNAGIFAWKAKTILTLIEKLQPSIYEGVCKIAEAWGSVSEQSTFEEVYPTLTKISVDYAIMENAPSVHMVPAGFRWDDVGSWLALEREIEPDEHGNNILGQSIASDTSRCVMVSSGDHTISTVGVEDLIIVHTEDVTLVAHRNSEQAIKQLYGELEKRNRSDLM